LAAEFVELEGALHEPELSRHLRAQVQDDVHHLCEQVRCVPCSAVRRRRRCALARARAAVALTALPSSLAAGLRFTVETPSKDMALVSFMKGGWRSYDFSLGSDEESEDPDLESLEITCAVSMEVMLEALLVMGKDALGSTELSLAHARLGSSLELRLTASGATCDIAVPVMDLADPNLGAAYTHPRAGKGRRGREGASGAMEEGEGGEGEEGDFDLAAVASKYSARFAQDRLRTLLFKVESSLLHSLFADIVADAGKGSSVTITVHPDILNHNGFTLSTQPVYTGDVPCLLVLRDAQLGRELSLPRTAPLWFKTPAFTALAQDVHDSAVLPPPAVWSYPSSSLRHTLRALSQVEKGCGVAVRVNGCGMMAITVVGGEPGGEGHSYTHFFLMPVEGEEEEASAAGAAPQASSGSAWGGGEGEGGPTLGADEDVPPSQEL